MEFLFMSVANLKSSAKHLCVTIHTISCLFAWLSQRQKFTEVGYIKPHSKNESYQEKSYILKQKQCQCSYEFTGEYNIYKLERQNQKQLSNISSDSHSVDSHSVTHTNVLSFIHYFYTELNNYAHTLLQPSS